ncbi:MAG TPA: NAD(P)H-hydrate epimerase, partial [Eoetvoesiella sp.]
MPSIGYSRHVLLTPDEMSAADKAAIVSGVSGTALMEAAGVAVAEAVCRRWSRRRTVILCGPGNNGGDGFVAARHLWQRGWPITVALLGSPEKLAADAAFHAALWEGPIQRFSAGVLNEAELVIDAVFGAGLSRAVDGVARETLELLQHSDLPVCAIDVPSGLDGTTGDVLGFAAEADLTVTFFRKKPGHLLLPGRLLCGEVVLADIGISDSVLRKINPLTYENDPELWLAPYPWPETSGHKYQRGHVVVAGGLAMTGASRLSALSAARAGAGLVTLAAPLSVWPVYAAALTSIMVQPLADDGSFAQLLADERKNTIVVGPGAGVNETTRGHVLAALATARGVVLDADAITSFADTPQALLAAIQGPCVLTPHEGE